MAPEASPPAEASGDGGARQRRAALAMLAGWMGERYFRTFRPLPGDEPTAFDALLARREARVGVTIGLLHGDGPPPPGAAALEALLGGDLADEPGGYALWVPPGAALPEGEPGLSGLRASAARACAGLAPGERRELRLPVTLALAKVDAEGAYVSVAGPLAAEWTTLSEGVGGAFHLDARALRRLPEERAELDVVIARVRDRAAMLDTEEVAQVETHDYWLVSRLPLDEPSGATVFGAAPDFDPGDGATVRRALRALLARAAGQRVAASEAGEEVEMTAVLLGAPYAHAEEELATAALRGMNSAAWSGADLVALAADGAVRQLLQPRSLPWERAR